MLPPHKTMADEEEFAKHAIFADLDIYIDFYEQFSFSVMNFPTMGTKAIINIDSYVYSSIQGTLESIKVILRNGRIGDSYALLRKYHDAAITNVYTNLFLDENFKLENFDVKEISGWLDGTKKIPTYGTMRKYVSNSDKVTAITNLLRKNDLYIQIKNRCEDHLHYNFFRNFIINDNEVFNTNRIELLTTLQADIRNVLILHLSYIFYLNDHYLIASDYIDAMELGMTPEKDSQYWVAEFVQNIFTSIVAKYRPDIRTEIILNTAMHLKG